MPSHARVLRVVNSAIHSDRALESQHESLGRCRGCGHHQLRIGCAERDLAEAQPRERMRAARVLRDRRPARAAIGRAQDAETVVRIARTVRLAGSHQDYALGRVGIGRGLNCDRAHCERRLVVKHRRPNHARRARAQRSGIVRTPHSAVRSAEVHRVAGRVRRIDRNRRRSSRN